jgi:hypothetical protein
MLSVYKQVLTSTKKREDNIDWIGPLIRLQSPQIWSLFLLGSGHFVGMVIDTFTAKPLMSKTFHRYTTRKKQGGAQSGYFFLDI